MKTFIKLFILGFLVSCASYRDKSNVSKEQVHPYIDRPGYYK